MTTSDNNYGKSSLAGSGQVKNSCNMLPAGLEPALIEECKNGDHKAQLQVYKSCYRQMFEISFSHVGNADAADEIVRESFMAAFDRIRLFQGLADFICRLQGQVEQRSVEMWMCNNVPIPGLVIDHKIVK